MRTLKAKTNRILSASGLCLCLLFALVGSGCKKAADEPKPAEGPSAAAELQKPAQVQPATPGAEVPQTVEPRPDAPAVTINGEVITEGEVASIVNPQVQRASANVPAAYLDQFKQQFRQRVISTLIAQRLVDQQVQAAHIEVTEAEVATSMNERLAQMNPSTTMERFKEMVESQGGDFEATKEQFRMNLLREKFLETNRAGKVDVNDQDVRTYYDDNAKEFETPERVQASHILVKPDVADPNSDPNEAKAAALKEAEGLLAQVKAGGDFAELAKAHSDCPSASRGGDLGLFERERMVKPFSDAAFAMEPNEVSEIVETQFGYHIIKVTDRQEGRVVPFEEAQDGIRARLTSEKEAQIDQALLQSLRDKATIVYPPAEDKPAMAPPAAPAIPVSPGGAAPASEN